MAGVNVKMGVDVSQFKQGIQEASSSVKTLDAALRMNEKQLKATGDAELYMANKSKLLNQQMESQKKVVANIQKQMAEMKASGVDETSAAYQKLERALYNAAGKMMDIQTELNGLANSEQKAAEGASLVAANVASINKKVSFDAVIRGIDSITSAMSKAAQKAVSLGEAIWDNIMTSAQWGDDIATQAMMAQMGVEEYQRVVNVAATNGETSTDSLIKSWKKVKMNLTSDSDDVVDAFKKLGVAQSDVIGYSKYGDAITQARDYMDVYWEIGEALMQMSDSAEQERLAQTLLGRSWQESIPMFLMGREAYEKALKDQDVVSEDNVKKLGELNDKVKDVEQRFETLKNTVIAEIAPTLTTVAESIGGMLSKLNEYLQTDEGQALLARLGESIEKIFSSLADIDPEKVVGSFVDVFDKLTEAFEWVANNWGTVVTAIEGIGGAFVALKLGSGALKILQLINGLKELGGASGLQQALDVASGGTAGGDAGNAAGAAAGATTKKAIVKGAVKDALKTAAVAYAAYDLAYGSTVRVNENIQEQADKINEELDRQESSFTGYSDPETVAAWKFIREHANDKGENGGLNFLEGLADRYYKWYWSADENHPELANYEDPFWDAFQRAYDNDFISVDTYDQMKEMIQSIQVMQRMKEQGFTGGWDTFDLDTTMKLLNQLEAELAQAANNQEPEVPVQPTVDDAAVQNLEEQVGTITIPATLALISPITGEAAGEYANGLWSVPWDGYPAILHKGERVVPAREAGANSYNSNLYVESMYMNNGTDAEGLAAAMAAAQRRTMSGYGS